MEGDEQQAPALPSWFQWKDEEEWFEAEVTLPGSWGVVSLQDAVTGEARAGAAIDDEAKQNAALMRAYFAGVRDSAQPWPDRDGDASAWFEFAERLPAKVYSRFKNGLLIFASSETEGNG